jgi:hypothetical protein
MRAKRRQKRGTNAAKVRHQADFATLLLHCAIKDDANGDVI